MPQRQQSLMMKRVTQAGIVFGLLAAIAGSFPLFQWLDTQIVSAEELDTAIERQTRGFTAITGAIQNTIRTDSLMDLDTRISVLQGQVDQAKLALYRNLGAQADFTQQHQPVPEYLLSEQVALESQITALESKLTDARDADEALRRVPILNGQ